MHIIYKMMISHVKMVKRLRKGMTLLELVIAMALTSIVLAGAGVALFSMQRVSNREAKNHTALLEAKNLSYAIDQTIKAKEYVAISLTTKQNNIGKDSCETLLTLDSTVYGFDGKTFGIIEENKIEGENRMYQANNPMHISYVLHGEGLNQLTEFKIHYGDNYGLTISLIERI